MGRKYILQETTREVTNLETNRVEKVDQTKTFVVKTDDADKFFQVYYNMVASWYELNRVADIKVLMYLCQIAEFNTGEVSLSAAKRTELCHDLTIANSALSRSLKALKEKDLITGDKGTYYINPAIFWKGDAKARKEQLTEDGLYFGWKFKTEDAKS